MPRHQHTTTCRKGGGPLSKFCSCEHCNLAICRVCGAWEGSLTTDCPGVEVEPSKREEVYETNLDYTDDRGWHLGDADMKTRCPRFEGSAYPPDPLPSDPREIAAPATDWVFVDRVAALEHALALKAIAWVLADRVADKHSSVLSQLEDAIDSELPRKEALRAHTGEVPVRVPNEKARELLAALEKEKILFKAANKRAEACDDEFRQIARRIVDTLESK